MQIYTKDLYNAIFIQPTTACSLNCPGCYVKRYEKEQKIEKDLTVPQWMHTLTRYMLSGGRLIRANQVTISLNNPHHLIGIDGLYQATNDYEMLAYLNAVCTARKHVDTELHFTMSAPAVKQYESMLPFMAKIADVITVSVDDCKNSEAMNYAQLHNAVQDTDAKLNCNLLFTPRIAKYMLEDSRFGKSVLFEFLLRQFNTIYLVAYKPNLGEEYSPSYITTMRNLVTFYNSLPSDLKEKRVFLDGCANVCAEGEFGCSAGINMITVWPDGSLTGCPYSSKPLMKTKKSNTHSNFAYDVIDNMKLMKNLAKTKLYEFDRCKLRNLWLTKSK